MLQEISELNMDELLKGFEMPKMGEAYKKEEEANKRRRLKNLTRKYRERRRRLRKKLMTPIDYNDYHDPMTAQPAERFKNPYDYGTQPMTRHNEPQDKTNAAVEAEMVFAGEVDLFDKRLFPAQNRRSYSEKSGREFLADFTKATRGQLVVSMSRLAQENPREFAKLWIEMEKFNTPQQSAVDLNASVTAKASLYDKLDQLSVPDELPMDEAEPIMEETPFAEDEPVPTEGEGIEYTEDYPPATEEDITNQ